MITEIQLEEGGKYVGYTVAGQPNGEGKSYYRDGRIQYDGHWSNGLFQKGRGYMYGSDGLLRQIVSIQDDNSAEVRALKSEVQLLRQELDGLR